VGASIGPEGVNDELAAIDGVQLGGGIDRALAGRAGLRLVRDDVLALMQVGISAEQVRTALQIGAGKSHAAAGQIGAQLRMEAAARARILGFDMLDAGQVADYLGSTGHNRRQAASGLRQTGKLVGLEHNGRVRYPAFQIDAARGRVRPVVAELNQRLGARDDPWGVASWWLNPHARLRRGQSPADLAVSDRDRDGQTLRALAQALAED